MQQRERKPSAGSQPVPRHIVVLVHGIRDYALWQTAVRSVLACHFTVEVINYGRFDLFRFLFPGTYFRNKAIEKVWDQIVDIRKMYPKAKLSFVGHSFGTFLLAELLRRKIDFVAHRVVFCGSVVRYDYPFEQFSDRFSTPILNEVGAKDIWPAMAESVTWGYGSGGTFGFRRSRVRDRWHAGANHGYFLDAAFCEKFWTPFLRDGEIVEGESRPAPPRLWVRVASQLRLKYAIPSLCMIAIFVAAFFSSVDRSCHPYDPATDKPELSLPGRPCLHGRLSYLKWIDESVYPAVDRPSGRWPNDRANRTMSIGLIDETGTPVWAERNLFRVDNGHDYWQPQEAKGSWTEIVGRSALVVPGEIGLLVRRQDLGQSCGGSQTGKRRLLEAFVPSDVVDQLSNGIDVRLRFRWVFFDCSDSYPLKLTTELDHPGPFFDIGRITKAANDR